ncbi:MAG TPA: ADOP family duplicated permease [Bryobacteraceae bacterium]|jgi:putative ABC transport system permease protein|nr:ADOP family duplicated permease [Bryobacteraceae bacterium]
MALSTSRWISDFREDAKYGSRSFLRSPQLLVVSMLSLGLAVGVNTTIFSLVRAIIGKHVTAAEPDRLVRMKFGPGTSAIQVSYPDYKEIRNTKAFADLTGFADLSANWRLGEGVRRVETLAVTANFFDVLRTQAKIGRLFGETEAEHDPRIAVISYQLWQRSGTDPGLIGRTVVINGEPYVISGVLPLNFRSVTTLALAPDLYVPLSSAVEAKFNERSEARLNLLGRLRPGESTLSAQAALTPIMQYLKKTYPSEDRNFSAPQVLAVTGIEEMQQDGMGVFVGFFGLLLVIVGVVVLIACVNISTLIAARAISRRREMAMRLALGARRGRLIRQLLTESLLLSLFCTSFGLLLHLGLTRLISRIQLPLPFPITLDMSADWQLFAYSLALVFGATIICGLVPVRQATRFDLNSTLKQTASTQTSKLRLSRLLVSSEFGMAAMLVVITVLFLQNLRHLSAVSPGFDIDHTALVSIRPQSSEEQLAKTSVVQRLDQLTSLPGIESATVALAVPLTMSTGNSVNVRAVDRKSSSQLGGEPMWVGPKYFSTIEIPVLAGREFGLSDKLGAPDVAILNQTLARRMFPDRSPVGQRITVQEDQKEQFYNVIGVVQDSKYGTLGEAPHPAVFLPFLQTPQPGQSLNLFVRTAGNPEAFRAEIQTAMRQSDPASFVQVTPMRENLATVLLPDQVAAALLSIIGLLAAVLALAGVYGIVDYSVGRRTSEIGVRMAIGASGFGILGLIMRDTLRNIVPGMFLGLLLASVLTKLIGAFLAFGVHTADPLTWLGVITFLAGIGAVAALPPALRAARLEPLIALRYE